VVSPLAFLDRLGFKLAHNVLQLGEVADLKAQMFQFSTELHLKTECSI